MEAERTGQIRSILATRVQNGMATQRGHSGSPLDYAQEHDGYGIYLDAGNPLSFLAHTYSAVHEDGRCSVSNDEERPRQSHEGLTVNLQRGVDYGSGGPLGGRND